MYVCEGGGGVTKLIVFLCMYKYMALYKECYFNVSIITSHQTFTCSKSTINTVEKGVKYVQS